MNIDILPLQYKLPPNIRFLQHDLRNGFPKEADSSVDLIRASHIIEHLTLEEAIVLAKECYRVLIPKGILRISVPDGDRIIEHYLEGDMAWYDDVQPQEFIDAPTQGEKLNRLLFSGDNAHKAVYNIEMMQVLLYKAGFKAIVMLPGWSHSETIERETKDQHIKESFVMEGVK